MPYKPAHRQRPPRRRSSIGRFFAVLFRFITRPFKVLARLIGGGRTATAWLKLGLVSLAAISVLGGVIGLITIAVFSRDLPDPNKLIDRQVAQSTKIYDRTGEHLLYEIAGEERRTIIQLDELPAHVSQAVIALEDQTFYEHSGFRYRRIIKAVLYKLMGRVGPGASTLTSQLVKNAILSPERTISRKLKEFILVFQIERKFSKDQILQLYLNEIPYGSNVYGIESAANFYFSKSARDLALEESALLAAIIQRPTYFSPYGSNVERLLERKDLTLQLMFEQGYITQEERDEAQSVELTFKARREDITAPHFVFHVREKLVEKYGEHMVNQGGLIVKTSLDLEMQKKAEEAVAEQVETNKALNASNAALVAMNPKNGEVLAMVGSIDYFNDEIDGQVNVATRPRQPGSSFKPIVYTLGWQRGYTPSTIVFDVNTTFPATDKPYEPKNYDLGERGPISLRKALQGSLNIPAVKMLYLLGVSNILDFAEELGYTTFADRSRFGLSLVLGGGEVTLLEHTAAYATLADEGMYHEPLVILEVSTSGGQILDTFEAKSRRAIEENIARITSNVLSDNAARAYVFGLGSHLQLGSRPVAAKTGTTNDYRDAWTMGYTPSLAAGVWAGNNDFSEMTRAGGSTAAAPIWNSFMRKALDGTPVESFTPPKITTPDKPILSGQGFGLKLVTIDRASEKLATEATPASFREDRLYVEAHNILHYVDRSNPTGPAPADPASADPQYRAWEDAVQRWIAARIEANEPLFDSLEDQNYPPDVKIEHGMPPTQEDDLHVPANQPRISLLSPASDEQLNSRVLQAEVQAEAPRGVARVEYFLDDVYLGASTSSPFSFSTSLKSFPNGFYTLAAVAYDDIDNSARTVARIRLQSDESYTQVRWLSPDEDSQLVAGDTVPLRLSLESTDPVSQVTFFADHLTTGESTLVDAIVNPSSNTLEVAWTPAQPGMYRLSTKISAQGSGVFSGPSRDIEIIRPPEPEEEEAGE